MKRTLLLLAILILSSIGVKATHHISFELTYEYLDGDSFLIRGEYMNWCGGSMATSSNPPMPTAQSVQIQCNGVNQMGLTLWLVETIDLPVYCHGSQSLNACVNSSTGYTGYQVGVFEGVLHTAALTCSSNLQVVYSTGARSSTVNVIAQPSYTTIVEIDANNFSNLNSARSFRYDIPGAFVDSNQYSFSVAMYDADGDSLTYELDTARNLYTNGNWVMVAYASGFSASNPAQNFTLDPQTGQIDWFPTIPVGYEYAPYVVVIRTDEWDPVSGVFLGSTYRDVQFLVIDGDLQDHPEMDAFTNLTGAVEEDSMSIRACAGDTFCFDVTFSDANTTDSVFISSNLEMIADYYDITVTGVNPTTASICAVINETYNYGIDAIIKAWDNHCDAIGQSSYRLHIRTVGGSNQSISGCFGSWDTVSTMNDSLTIWSVLMGDSMSAATFNCVNTNCTQAALNPFNSTTYIAENYMTGGCGYHDTIEILTDSTFLMGIAQDASSNPISGTKVYRVIYDAGADTVYAVDSTVTQSNGSFSFALDMDSFLLKVSPDSVNYPLLLPTYYDGKVTVQTADFIQPLYCDTLDILHVAVPGYNPGGPGFIAGYVSQGAGRGEGDPVKGLDVVLMDDLGQPVAHEVTNSEGYFRFSGLVNSTYSVFVDRWGIDNELAPTLTLIEGENEIDSLQFVLHPNHLELLKSVGTSEFREKHIRIYPNPAGHQVTIESSELDMVGYRIHSATGQLIRSKAVRGSREVVDLTGLSSGIYFLEVRQVGGDISKMRLIIQ